MPSNGSQRNFHWSAADGRQLAIALGSAQITVTDGVAIKVGPGAQDGGKPTLDLDLVGEYLVLVPQVNRPYQGHHQQQAEEQSAQAPVDR
jgi:hypothetical protein